MFHDLSQHCQWIGLRENLQETMVLTIKYRGFPVKFPIIQFYDIGDDVNQCCTMTRHEKDTLNRGMLVGAHVGI